FFAANLQGPSRPLPIQAKHRALLACGQGLHALAGCMAGGALWEEGRFWYTNAGFMRLQYCRDGLQKSARRAGKASGIPVMKFCQHEAAAINSAKRHTGLCHLYWGDGKGKTTA